MPYGQATMPPFLDETHIRVGGQGVQFAGQCDPPKQDLTGPLWGEAEALIHGRMLEGSTGGSVSFRRCGDDGAPSLFKTTHHSGPALNGRIRAIGCMVRTNVSSGPCVSASVTLSHR